MKGLEFRKVKSFSVTFEDTFERAFQHSEINSLKIYLLELCVKSVV